MRVVIDGTPLQDDEIILDEIYIQFVGQKGADSPPSDDAIRNMISMLNQMIMSRN